MRNLDFQILSEVDGDAESSIISALNLFVEATFRFLPPRASCAHNSAAYQERCGPEPKSCGYVRDLLKRLYRTPISR
jgi:hypothetical protein